jgi:cyclopropane fatty-acyl-phospholipid synthase-like methyltransferase
MLGTFREFEELLRAYRKSSVLLSAFELGIFKALASGPLSINQLEQHLGYSKRGLGALLTALLAMNVIDTLDDHYQINPKIASFLNPTSQHYAGGQIEHEVYLHKRWQYLSESIKTGQPSRRDSVTEETTRRFIAAMSDVGRRSAKLVVETVPFRKDETILDMGGGPGQYAEAFCAAFSSVCVTIFDQRETIDAAQEFLKNNHARSRISFIAGDFFNDSIEEQYDSVFCSNVIHMFNSEQILELFKKWRTLIKPGGRILIKDLYLNNTKNGPLNNTLFSLHMLLSTESGTCYKESEIIKLLTDAGFEVTKTYSLSEFSAVIEGKIGEDHA